jgi:hypothetical protein
VREDRQEETFFIILFLRTLYNFVGDGQEESFEEAAQVKKEIETLRQHRDSAALLDTVMII